MLRYPPQFPLPSAPTHVFTLEYLLQGCLVQARALTAPLTLLGRDADACALPLTDASASRVHCALAYDARTNALLLCDNGSANGTFLMKRRLEAGVWTELRVGSQVRCGTDARVFVVSAPVGFEEGGGGRERQPPPPDPASASAAPPSAGTVVGIAAGEAAEEAAEGAEDPRSAQARLGLRVPGGGKQQGGALSGHWLSTLDHAGLTEKEREGVAKLQAKLQRLAALRLEAVRIEAKEASQAGLTEGQLAQLSRLNDSIGALVEVLEEEDSGLRRRIEARRNPAAAGGAAGAPPPPQQQQQERELPSAWLRDSVEDVKDVSMRRGAAPCLPRRTFTLTARGGAGAPAARPAAAPQPPHPAPPQALFNTGALENEASLAKRLTAVRRRLVEVRAAAQDGCAEALSAATAVGGASTDALDVFVETAASVDAQAWLARMRGETQALEEEERGLLHLLALLRPAQLEESSAAAPPAVTAAAAAAAAAVAQGSPNALPHLPVPTGSSPQAPPAHHPAPTGLAGLLSAAQGGGEEEGSRGDRAPPAKRPRTSTSSASANHAGHAAFAAPQGHGGYDAEPEDLTRFH